MKLIADLPIVDPKEGLASEQLKRGILETGFFLLKDRSVALEALHELRRQTYEFFGQPIEEKNRYQMPGRGYTALYGDDTQASFGNGVYGMGDYCEKFTMGPILTETDILSDPAYYQTPEAEPFSAQNVFPNAQFEVAWNNYYQHMHELSEELMAAIRTVLGYPAEQWQDITDRPVSVMRFLAYPAISSDDARLAEHYDDDLITILHQSPTANGFDALEVMLPGDNKWRSVVADDTLFVVNVGQALTHLTNGKVVSTKHRVVSPPKNLEKGSARSSVVYFHSPNWNAPLPALVASDMDQNLGQSSPGFHLEDLIEPDGSILFYKVLQREFDRMTIKKDSDQNE